MELVGKVMVDSGQVMVGDPCYLDRFVTHGNNLNLEPEDCKLPYAYSYEGACQASNSKERSGDLDSGYAVAVETGYGDGFYPVYVEKNREGRVVSMHVFFDDDPNED